MNPLLKYTTSYSCENIPAASALKLSRQLGIPILSLINKNKICKSVAIFDTNILYEVTSKIKMLKISVTIMLVTCFFLSGLNAQSVIAPAGNHTITPSVSLSWTLGEPVIKAVDGSEAILGQGFLQTGIRVTPLKELHGLNLLIKAYPNPASELIFLETQEYENFSWHLYDIKGKLLITKKIESRITEIPVADLAPASYLLKINKKGNEVKAFKVVIN